MLTINTAFPSTLLQHLVLRYSASATKEDEKKKKVNGEQVLILQGLRQGSCVTFHCLGVETLALYSTETFTIWKCVGPCNLFIREKKKRNEAEYREQKEQNREMRTRKGGRSGADARRCGWDFLFNHTAPLLRMGEINFSRFFLFLLDISLSYSSHDSVTILDPVLHKYTQID